MEKENYPAEIKIGIKISLEQKRLHLPPLNIVECLKYSFFQHNILTEKQHSKKNQKIYDFNFLQTFLLLRKELPLDFYLFFFFLCKSQKKK